MLFLFHSMIFLWNHYDYSHLIQNGVFHPFILNQPNQNVLQIQVQDQPVPMRRIVDDNLFFENNVEFRRRRNLNLDLIETEEVE
jgi:hypothetical protein